MPSADQKKVRIVLAGDSTVTDGSGWGVGFARCLTDRAELQNLAKGGRSSKSFRDEGLWQACLDARPDYILIQFGHNDCPGKGPERETDPETTYRANMTRYVEDSRAAGAVPVLVTSLCRRQRWTTDGRIDSDLFGYANVVKDIAAKLNVPLIDLHALSIATCTKLGRDGCIAISPKADDATHLNERGSALFGPIVAGELARIVSVLSAVIHSQG